jgi:hypothetical protein
MNERIEKLAEGCFEYFDPNCNGETMEFNYKKFAELIVRECANIVNSLSQHEGPRDCSTAEYIKEHFGVEE